MVSRQCSQDKHVFLDEKYSSLYNKKQTSINSIVSDMQGEFFNSIYPKQKVEYLFKLFNENLSDDNIKLILKSIVDNHVENNFDKVEPFNDVKKLSEMIKGKKPNEILDMFNGLKSSIFDKSKF